MHSTEPRFESRLPLMACLAAATLPTLVAYNLPPSPTLFNQALALGLWGVVVAIGSVTAHAGLRTAWSLLAALALLALAVAGSGVLGSLPASLSTSAALSVLAAAVMAASGSAIGAGPHRHRWLDAFFAGWLCAGVIGAAIGIVQVFFPAAPDGDWIARSGLVGRAVGNLRQPNHLSSLLLWSAVSVVPLLERRVSSRGVAAALMGLMALMVFGITLSGSRTGLVGIGVLALWGLADRRLSGAARLLLVFTPLMYGLSWAAMSVWAGQTAQTFGAALHMAAGGDISSSRFAIWRDTLALIAMHPWAGVGFGEFNFAWSLTPFPHRPVAFFDHTHNLPLQLAVELGLPLALLVLGLLALALWQAWQRSLQVAGADGSGVRAAFVMVLLMALHSELEYPLWYLYFLLPTAWSWGVCLGSGHSDPAASGRRPAPWAAGIALVLAAGVVLADYWRVVVIFAPGANAGPLSQRIAEGQRSWFFGHHADYAAATTADKPSRAMAAFSRASHNLLDTRLMVAWARAYAERGDLDRARHLAQRLREFHNPQSDEFFAPCDDAAVQPKPFQCQPPSPALDWRDFR